MSYCRYCGREITYKRTKNDKWMSCDVAGNPHFCNEEKSTDSSQQTGLSICSKCGKPVFKTRGKWVDYTTLKIHVCRKIDITNYQKYLEKSKKK